MWMERKREKTRGVPYPGLHAHTINFKKEIKMFSRLAIQGYDDITFELVFAIHSLERLNKELDFWV